LEEFPPPLGEEL